MEQLKELLNLITAIAPILAIAVVAIIGCWAFYFLRNRQKTANEAKKVGNPNSGEKPEIVVFLRPHAACVQYLMLCIENIGTGTAYNVQFGTGASAPFIRSSNIGNVKIFKKNDFLRRGISCFGAGQKIEQFLINLIDGLPEELKIPLQIPVTYTDSLNEQYEKRYTLDFSDFESLGLINSEMETSTSALSSSSSNQVVENVEPSTHLQTAKLKGVDEPSDVAVSSKESKKTPQSVSEEDNVLSPDLQHLVTMYNAGKETELRGDGKLPNYARLDVTNETELRQYANTDPIFETTRSGNLAAYATDSKNIYAVMPRSGLVLQSMIYSDGAFGKVFKCPNFDPKCKYHMKVIRPAMFTPDPINEKWTLQEMGELELTVHDN